MLTVLPVLAVLTGLSGDPWPANGSRFELKKDKVEVIDGSRGIAAATATIDEVSEKKHGGGEKKSLVTDKRHWCILTASGSRG